MSIFVERRPAWVCSAIHLKGHQISQTAPQNSCLTNQSAFAIFPIRTLRCGTRPNPPAQRSTASREKCVRLRDVGNDRVAARKVWAIDFVRNVFLELDPRRAPAAKIYLRSPNGCRRKTAG